MTYSYDSHGWLSPVEIAGRTTEVDPPEHGEAPSVGQPWPNFTGVEWVSTIYSTPVIPEPVVPPNPTEWLIDIGPFFDRFGASKLPILMSTDATVRAIIADIQVRKWINLHRADVGQVIDLLISKSLCAATVKTAVLTTPVTPEENLALRKLYFGG